MTDLQPPAIGTEIGSVSTASTATTNAIEQPTEPVLAKPSSPSVEIVSNLEPNQPGFGTHVDADGPTTIQTTETILNQLRLGRHATTLKLHTATKSDIANYIKSANEHGAMSRQSYMKLFIIILFVIILILAAITLELEWYEQKAIYVAFIYGQCIFLTFKSLYFSKNICALRMHAMDISGFDKTITFPTELIRLMEYPMESISEFGGVRGGTLHISMHAMSIGNGILILDTVLRRTQEIATMLNWNIYHNASTGVIFYNVLDIRQKLIFLSAIGAAFGVLFIGFFEMNKFSKIDSIFHYVGVCLLSQGCFAFGLLVNFDAGFWVISVLTVLLIALFFVLTMKYGHGRRYVGNENNIVHKVSILLIGTEAAILTNAALVSSLALANFGNM